MSPEQPLFAPPRPEPAQTRAPTHTTRPARGDRLNEVADAEWLYAWSLQNLRPTGESVAPRVTPPG
jgi:hypothetical protein